MASSDKSATRVEAVVASLRDDIFRGKYPPGTPLRELTLANELSVSQATIREALQRLQYLGLVSRRPNLGSAVTRLTVKEVRERIELRAALEIKAALEASERMGESEFAELESRRIALDSAVETNSYYEAAQNDLKFHRYIWQCSDNETLCHHLELLTVPLFAFLSIVRSQVLEQLPKTVEAHRPLVEALRSRDTAQIRAIFERGATSAYGEFLDPSRTKATLTAFGFLDP